MTRAIAISLFILCFSFGMAVTSAVNEGWNAVYNVPYIQFDRAPYLTYSQTGLPQNELEYNTTLNTLTTFNKPADVNFDLGLFQNIKYGGILIGLLLNLFIGLPFFLVSVFGMPSFLATPMFLLIVLNHILAVIYIVTGRTFIY